MLPAKPEVLERVRLELEVRRRLTQVSQMQSIMDEEQTEQARIRRMLDQKLAPLRSDIEKLSAEINRLEIRLERLVTSGRSLSDDELDFQEDDTRAEEAAWWAEWRHRQSERKHSRTTPRTSKRPDDITLRRTYRALARLIHPDHARSNEDRERRELAMRVANEAKETHDLETLRQLLTSWSESTRISIPLDTTALRARVSELGITYTEARRQLRTLRQSAIGKLLRVSERDLKKHLKDEENRLRREVALYRLRRRRLLRALDEKREELNRVYADTER